MLRASTDFVYVRMHGPDHHHLCAGSYPGADLTWWADRTPKWSPAVHDVFVYFNNDGNANAVRRRGPSKRCWRPTAPAIRPRRQLKPALQGLPRNGDRAQPRSRPR